MPPDIFLRFKKFYEPAKLILAVSRESRRTRRLSRTVPKRIFPSMNLKDKSSVVAHLTTVGCKSGEPRTVELRFLFFDGNFYATTTRVKGKHWCQNMLKNPAVEMSVQGKKFSCVAKQVTDDNFRKQILTLRDSPPQLERAVFEIVPQR